MPDDIAKRIKTAREEERRTIGWMAQKLRVHRNTYSAIEAGETEITVSRLAKISELTRRPISWFVYGDDGVDKIELDYAKDFVRIKKLLSNLPAGYRTPFLKLSIHLLEFLDQIAHRKN